MTRLIVRVGVDEKVRGVKKARVVKAGLLLIVCCVIRQALLHFEAIIFDDSSAHGRSFEHTSCRLGRGC